MCEMCVSDCFSCGSFGVLGDFINVTIFLCGGEFGSYSKLLYVCVCETHIVIGGIFDCSDAQYQH